MKREHVDENDWIFDKNLGRYFLYLDIITEL